MIPKIIHKIILVDDGKIPSLPEGLSKAFESFYRQNPNYKVKIYSGDDCVNYIKENFDEEILLLYNKLKPFSYKCDFMRHLILYNEGGWYSDLRQICLEPLDILNNVGKEYYTSIDCPPNQNCMYTAFIGSIPKHPISYKMIELIKWNIKHKHYGLDCLYPTGPGAYMIACIDHVRIFPEKCMIGKHVIENGEQFIDFGNVRIIKCKYNNAKGADNSDIKGTNDYGEMWRNRDVYI